MVLGPTLCKLFQSYRLLRCISFKPVPLISREALTNAILSWVECFRIYHPTSGAATCGGHIVTVSYMKKLSRSPLNRKKLSRTCVRECWLFLTKDRLVLSLDGQFLLFWAIRFQFLPTSIDANGPSLREEGASYWFTSSVVNLAIEMSVYRKRDCWDWIRCSIRWREVLWEISRAGLRSGKWGGYYREGSAAGMMRVWWDGISPHPSYLLSDSLHSTVCAIERVQSPNTLASFFLQNSLSNGRCGFYAGDSFQIVMQAAAPQKDCDGRNGWNWNEIHELL